MSWMRLIGLPARSRRWRADRPSASIGEVLRRADDLISVRKRKAVAGVGQHQPDGYRDDVGQRRGQDGCPRPGHRPEDGRSCFSHADSVYTRCYGQGQWVWQPRRPLAKLRPITPDAVKGRAGPVGRLKGGGFGRSGSELLKPWKPGDTAIPLTPALSRGRGSRIVRPERSTGFPGLRVSVRRDQKS